MLLDPRIGVSSHKRRVLKALYKQEVHDSCCRYTTEDTGKIFKPGLIVESKDSSDYPLNDHTEDKRNSY